VRIDLHAHTTASDGTDSPTELVAAAVTAGLDVLAVTDHDTTGGWHEALAARPAALTILPGAEFSCFAISADGRRIALHLLGYLFDPESEPLRTERIRLRASRLDRGRRMVDRLAEDGYPVTWDRVSELAAGGAVGRPHIGRALVEGGAVATVDEAFADLLSSRQRYYERKQDLPVLDAIALIRAAGGLPVFAHPLARRRGPVVSAETVAAMAAAGLVGLEVDHPDHGREDRAEAAALAAELDLVATGSSDYHGTNKTTRLGAVTTTEASYRRLLEHPSARRPVGPST
jgi:predicted metal-dependent phosphoesterase TrpH